jgi:hypothetical protein
MEPLDLSDLRFRRDVERVHRLGPRVLAELLGELGGKYLIGTPIEALVREYAKLDLGTLCALGGDSFPS